VSARNITLSLDEQILREARVQAAGVSYAESVDQIEMVLLDGVAVPFASPALLWKKKQTVRDKDQLDRVFLARVLAQGE
jgi:hypothetical protein